MSEFSESRVFSKVVAVPARTVNEGTGPYRPTLLFSGTRFTYKLVQQSAESTSHAYPMLFSMIGAQNP